MPALPKLLWVTTHLKILWKSLDSLNKIEYCTKICFEHRHGNILTYEHRLKFG